MLDALKKKLGMSPVKEETELDNTTTTAVAAEVITTEMYATLQASFEAQTETLKQVSEKFTELTTKLAETQVALLVAEQSKAEAVAQVHKSKMASRKLLVSASLGDGEKADSFLAATEMLDDTAFAAVSSALAGSVAVEANTTLFKEVGVDAKADMTKSSTEEKSIEMKLLEEKYKTAAQPANI